MNCVQVFAGVQLVCLIRYLLWGTATRRARSPTLSTRSPFESWKLGVATSQNLKLLRPLVSTRTSFLQRGIRSRTGQISKGLNTQNLHTIAEISNVNQNCVVLLEQNGVIRCFLETTTTSKPSPRISLIQEHGMFHSCELQVLCCGRVFRERQGGCGKTGSLLRPSSLPSMRHVQGFWPQFGGWWR